MRPILASLALLVSSPAFAELCGSGGDGSPMCTVRSITAEVKAELEKEHDRAHLNLSFDAAATNDDLKTVTKLPWLTSVSVNRCDNISDIAPLASLKKLTYLPPVSFLPPSTVTNVSPIQASIRRSTSPRQSAAPTT